MKPTCARKLLRRAMIGLVVLLTTAVSAVAMEPDEVLKDPALETRARHISAELRCPVCQNQSIDDSNAPLARDLRVLVRERLVAGDSDAAVMRFLVERYGDFVLLRPPFSPATLLLWFTPALVLLAVGGMLLRSRRGMPQESASEAPLSESEQEKLASLLADASPVAKTK